MMLWAIVPVKPLQRSKSKLLQVLTREEVASLGRQMLSHTLQTLAQIPQIEHTLVVSRDSQALAIAREHGARTVTERGTPELGDALVRASLVVQGYGISSVLVLPADLPLITSRDIEDLIGLLGDPPEVILAPDRRESGTNAILSSPPGLLEYDFGPESFPRHLDRAKAAGVNVKICRLPSLELDLDVPDDLEVLKEMLSKTLLIQEKE